MQGALGAQGTNGPRGGRGAYDRCRQALYTSAAIRETLRGEPETWAVQDQTETETSGKMLVLFQTTTFSAMEGMPTTAVVKVTMSLKRFGLVDVRRSRRLASRL